MAKKNEPIEGNSIDQLNEHLTKTGQRISENRNVIVWVLGGIIAVGLLVAAYFYFFYTPGVEKAFTAYGKVEVNANGNDTIAAEGYKKVADQFSGDAANLAALEAAEAYYRIGKYKEALQYVDKFSTKDDILKSNVEILKGDCQVNLKKYDDALSSFKKALDACDANPEIAPRALVKMAIVYDAQKKYGEALKAYEQIQKEYPTFTFNNMPMTAYIEREKARLGK